MSYHNPFTPPRKSATFDDHTLAEIRRAAATGIYALDTGRICVAALNQKNIDVVCDAIKKVL